MSLSLDTRSFIDACLFVESASGRSAVQSLNRGAKHTIIGSKSYPGAMQLTRKATAGDIAKVTDAQIRGFVVKKLKRTGQWPKRRAEIDRMVKKERSRRKSAIGFAAFAGYSKAAKAFGGRGVRGVHSGFPKSSAARGWGRKASLGDKVATLVNTAAAIEKIDNGALQEGLNNAAKDLEDYGIKQQQKIFDKVKP